MQHISTIVVGLGLTPEADPSLGSLAAVEQAAWLAGITGARIFLVHSTDKEVYYDPLDERWAIVGEGVSAEGAGAIDALLEDLRHRGLKCEVRVGEEKPWLEIIQQAVREKAELVVVGRYDEAKERHKLGSITHKLLRKCPCPVWAVRPDHTGTPNTILAATDLTPVGSTAVRYAAWLASRADAELHALHCYQVPFSAQVSRGRVSEAEEQRRIAQVRERAREKIQADLEAMGAAERGHVHVVCNSPALGIRQAVDELDPDLLVMGTVSRTGIAGLMMGSTAEDLLGHVPCSLLTLKPDSFVSPVVAPAADRGSRKASEGALTER